MTKHGKPTILAIPFDETALILGVKKDMALQLFQSRTISLSKAARVAEIAVSEFMAILA